MPYDALAHVVVIRHDIEYVTLPWCHNERDGLLNHQHLHFLLNRLFGRISKKISKLQVTGHCEGNPLGTGGFHSQRASNAEIISIWWRQMNQWLPSFRGNFTINRLRSWGMLGKCYCNLFNTIQRLQCIRRWLHCELANNVNKDIWSLRYRQSLSYFPGKRNWWLNKLMY